MSSQQIQRTIDNAEDEIFAQVFTSLLKIGMPAQKRTREDSSIDDGAASSGVDQQQQQTTEAEAAKRARLTTPILEELDQLTDYDKLIPLIRKMHRQLEKKYPYFEDLLANDPDRLRQVQMLRNRLRKQPNTRTARDPPILTMDEMMEFSYRRWQMLFRNARETILKDVEKIIARPSLLYPQGATQQEQEKAKSHFLKMLMKWFNPKDLEDENMQQYIGEWQFGRGTRTILLGKLYRAGIPLDSFVDAEILTGTTDPVSALQYIKYLSDDELGMFARVKSKIYLEDGQAYALEQLRYCVDELRDYQPNGSFYAKIVKQIDPKILVKFMSEDIAKLTTEFNKLPEKINSYLHTANRSNTLWSRPYKAVTQKPADYVFDKTCQFANTTTDILKTFQPRELHTLEWQRDRLRLLKQVLDLDLNKLKPWSTSQGVKNAQHDIRELADALYNNGKFVLSQVYIGEAKKHDFHKDLINKMEKDRKEYDEKQKKQQTNTV